jgi:hypothetical protein
MSRKTIAFALVAAVIALAFSAGSHALRGTASPQGGDPQLRSNVPAGHLPATSLPAAARAAFQAVISPAAADRFGITDASYDQVRRIATTAAGTLFLVPGTHGACLFLTYAVSCGDPGATDEPVLALVVKPVGDDVLVGGGITSTAATSVAIATADGRSARLDSSDGTFSVTAASGLSAEDKIAFRAGGN